MNMDEQFVIYTTSAFVCPYCERAKNALEANSYTFLEKDISDPQIKRELLAKRPNARTVPQIFLSDGTYIGDSDALVRSIQTGSLAPLLDMLV